MSNWGYENENELNEGQGSENFDGPKALRDAYAAQKKTIEDLSAKLTSFLEREEKSKVQATFDNLGIPGAASVYQGPADPKAAEEWAKSMQSIFGGNQGGNPAVADDTTEQVPKLPASMQAQFERMTAAGQDGVPIGNIEAAAGSIGDASDVKGIIAAMERLNRM